MRDFQKQTQQYSTFGDKLLRHADVLHTIQAHKIFRPITVQLAPTEACDMHCTYCSVANRDKGKIDFDLICRGLWDFRNLGAKSVEITGGGNPLLYHDHGHSIKDVIDIAHHIGYKIGMITNSPNPLRYIDPTHLAWIRISLAGLDCGSLPGDYELDGLEGKVGLSYIINEATTENTIKLIAIILQKYPYIKFVRIAPDCLTDDSVTINARWGALIEQYPQMFIKDIGENYKPHPRCLVGLVRPYWTHSGIYICTSHVLIDRNYNDAWKICDAADIQQAWNEMNRRFQEGLEPYVIDTNKCWHCYYANNNQLLDAVVTELPDEDFA